MIHFTVKVGGGVWRTHDVESWADVCAVLGTLGECEIVRVGGSWNMGTVFVSVYKRGI